MTSKELIVFTDSGDTIVDEATQVRDARGIVQEAGFIPGADGVLRQLHEEGFTVALVADGEWESFRNVYERSGLDDCFDAWVVSEVVGEQKPAPSMFDTAMRALGLTDADRHRVVMVGNNLKKDVAGANRQGFISVWLDWSPRYFHAVEESDWQPDYTVHTPAELYELLHRLDAELTAQKQAVRDRLERLVRAFQPILYEDDEVFLRNMRERNLAGDDLRRYRHWEWTQGVGLYGLWRLYLRTREGALLDTLTRFFDAQLTIGFPALNVNTIAPFLTMALVGEHLGEERYLAPCRETAAWIMASFPRTEEGGFQHTTSDSLNEQELWDDTLFMTVLFLATMGRIEGREDYLAEARRQFLLHEKYLADPVTGLWYHGWTFRGRHNFARAFWGRGNSWVTMAIPELLRITDGDAAVRERLGAALRHQAESLVRCQSPEGMWHTLVDDPASYVESSATCGFGYGLMRGVRMGLLPPAFEKAAWRALPPMLDNIGDDGVVRQVSYGTPMGRESRDFYRNIEIKPMPYGQAMAMLFLNECLG